MKNKIFLLILLTIFALPVSAENASTTTGAREKGYLKENRASAKENVESRWEEFKAKREERRETFASTSLQWQARREEMRKRISDHRAEIKEKVSERMAQSYEKMFERMKAVADKLASHKDAVSLRIEKLEEKGFDLEKAKAELIKAEDLIEDLPELLDSKFEKIKELLAAENPKENIESIRTEVKAMKDALKEAHAALVSSIREIKNSSKDDKATTTPAN